MKITLDYLKNAFDEKGKKHQYYIVFSVLFLLAVFCCYSWFIVSGRSLIWRNDGWAQHYKSLLYYGIYLRNILRNLIIKHEVIIPDWDFYISEGSDVVNAMHYYVIGDPIALFSVFVPSSLMHYFFSFSCILRLYLAGIAFSELCFGTGMKNRLAVITGSLSYCLCFWGLSTAARHPYFLNPLIYFPMMILGIEKIIHKERPYLFVIASTLSAVSNFYFFYMIVILSIGYALIRLFILYGKDIKKGISSLLYMGLMAVIGVCIAGVLLLPVLLMFLNDSRMSVSQPFHLFYPLSYYSSLPSIFVSSNGGFWLYIGLSAPVIFAVLLLFINKDQSKLLKTLVIICVLIMLFPIGGRVLNGMSYMTNRWCWSFVLLCNYIFVYKWQDLLTISKKNWIYLSGFTFIYYLILMFLEYSRIPEALSAVPMFYFTLLVLREFSENEKKMVVRQILIGCICLMNTVNMAFWRFSPGGNNYSAQFMENSKIWNENLPNNEASVIKEMAGNELYPRYSGIGITTNIHMLEKISSTAYYFSISSPSVNEFRSDMEMRDDLFQEYEGYDDRTALNALSAVGYYANYGKKGYCVPYGYKYLESRDVMGSISAKYLDKLKQELNVDSLTEDQNSKVKNDSKSVYYFYKNQYSLPIGYSYDSYITSEKWEALDPVQRQEIQLSTALIDHTSSNIQTYNEKIDNYEIPYEVVEDSPEISKQDNCFVATTGNVSVTLRFPSIKNNSETYIEFKGLSFAETPAYDLYFGDDSVDPRELYNKTNWKQMSSSNKISIRKEKLFWYYLYTADLVFKSSEGVSKVLNYKEPDAAFSSGRHDYIVNMGYADQGIEYVTITFPKRGVYSFDSLKAYSIPMDGYEEKITRLKEDSLENLELGVDTVSGDINTETNKILCVAIPYSTGWKVYIDGNEQQLLQVNKRYIGAEITQGFHHIEFKYSMPFKKIGFCLTILGFAMFGVVIFLRERKEKIKSRWEEEKSNG